MYTNVGKLDEFPEGTIRAVNVDGQSVAVVNAGGTLHAFGNACTHVYLELSSGNLVPGGIACLYHGSVFDIDSGEPIGGPAASPLTLYDVRVEGDYVLVGAKA
jgi:nitrite reductase/ring-hydroxylating ferredoxin subunit